MKNYKMKQFNDFVDELINPLKAIGYRDVNFQNVCFQHVTDDRRIPSGVLRCGGSRVESVRDSAFTHNGIYPLAVITKIGSNENFDYHLSFEPVIDRMYEMIEELYEGEAEDLEDISKEDIDTMKESKSKLKNYLNLFDNLKSTIEMLKNRYPITISHGEKYRETDSLEKLNKYLDLIAQGG